MAKTLWWCEVCKASGILALDGLGVYDAMYRLEDSHNAHENAKELKCSFSTSRLRVEELAARGKEQE